MLVLVASLLPCANLIIFINLASSCDERHGLHNLLVNRRRVARGTHSNFRVAVRPSGVRSVLPATHEAWSGEVDILPDMRSKTGSLDIGDFDAESIGRVAADGGFTAC